MEIRILSALLFISGVMTYKDFDAKIYFFFGYMYDDHTIYDLDKAAAVLAHPSFNATEPIMLYSHGYVENAESPSVRAIVEAYIENGNYNILIIDWRKLSFGIYPVVASDLKELGSATAELLLKLISRKFPIKQIHVVGHSLGGQLAGYIGRSVIFQSDGSKKLKRLTALDPAGPDYFAIQIGTEHITKNDAEFVDVIHANAGLYGYPINTGTVDFWPNGGRTQPGCIIIFGPCSHQRSVYYWAESVQYGSAVTFTSINRETGDLVQMGNNCPLNATGTYDLSTNSEPPYSEG